MEVLIMAEQAVSFAAFVGIDWADEQPSAACGRNQMVPPLRGG